MNDVRLAEAVAGVTKRKIGDRWTCNRRSELDVSPVGRRLAGGVGVTIVRVLTPAMY
jgi:hypothetical protein